MLVFDPRGRCTIEEALAGSRIASVVWAVVDMDGDGSSPLLGGGDCDDFNADVNPSVKEVCNGIDDDCDGDADESDAEDASVWYLDNDSDTLTF